MHTISVSGDHLVTILDALFEYAWNPVLSLVNDTGRAVCVPLHYRIGQLLSEPDTTAAAQPGHTLFLDHRINAPQAPGVPS